MNRPDLLTALTPEQRQRLAVVLERRGAATDLALRAIPGGGEDALLLAVQLSAFQEAAA